MSNWILILVLAGLALYKAAGCIMNVGACV